MQEIFGLQMRDLMIAIVALLILGAIAVAALAWRNPLLFKLGIRNVPRRRAQTALIVVGLMLSTLIIAAAFTTGDTLSTSLRAVAFEITGPIDHVITFDTEAGRSVSQREAVVPQPVADDLAAAFQNDPDIQSFTRVIFDAVSLENLAHGQREPGVFLLGLDPAEADALGGIPAAAGGSLRLSDLQPGKIILNASAAEAVAAAPGDTIRLRVRGRLHAFEVSGIARDTLLSGKVDPSEPEGAVIHLADAQAIFEQPGRLTGIGVTGRGGIKGALARSDAIDAKLNAFLNQQAAAEVAAGTPPAERLYADALDRPRFQTDPFKQETVEDAELFGSLFTTFFLVMGLFSIAAGILLIFLIFAMLAEERKTEMGIARALGMQRSQLVQAFLAEGLAYALGAAVVGAAAGVLVAFGMVEVLDATFGEEFGFPFTQHVEPRSLVIAAGLGILLTLITVVASSFRVSHLNIVAAIRDLPDEGRPRRRRWSGIGMLTTLIGLLLLPLTPLLVLVGGALLILPGLGDVIRRRGWGEWVVLPAWRLMRWRQEWWVVLLLLGLLGILLGVDSESAFAYLFGLSTLPIGLVLLARRFHRAGRTAYSLMGALILFFWLAPQDWHNQVWGREFEGGIELFVLSGVMMVTGATVFVIFNLDLLVAPLRFLGRFFGRLAPAVRTAVAYPTTARYRTGMTVAMIAIIMFALITFTTINANFARAFTSDEAAGGFAVQADSTLNDQVDDLRGALGEAGATEVAADLAGVARLQIASAPGTDVRTLATERWDPLHDEPLRDADGNPIIDPAASGAEPPGVRRAWFTGVDDAFLAQSHIPLQARAVGFDSDAAVWQALRDPAQRYAVVSFNAVTADDFAGSEDDGFEMPETIDESSTRIPRVQVELRRGDTAVEVTIIGVIDQVVGITAPPFPALSSILTREDLLRPLYAGADFTRHLARVRPGVDPLDTARRIEAALGIETVSILDELKDQQKTFDAVFKLFQGFTGLGLLAGLAALGVIAVRAVVERRQQIGVLRAIGYRRRLVRLGLLLEMGFIACLGVGLGSALAVVLSWRLFDEGAFGSMAGLDFYVPIGQIGIFAAAALLASLLFTYLPARQAARLRPADALRYE